MSLLETVAVSVVLGFVVNLLTPLVSRLLGRGSRAYRARRIRSLRKDLQFVREHSATTALQLYFYSRAIYSVAFNCAFIVGFLVIGLSLLTTEQLMREPDYRLSSYLISLGTNVLMLASYSRIRHAVFEMKLMKRRASKVKLGIKENNSFIGGMGAHLPHAPDGGQPFFNPSVQMGHTMPAVKVEHPPTERP